MNSIGYPQGKKLHCLTLSRLMPGFLHHFWNTISVLLLIPFQINKAKSLIGLDFLPSPATSKIETKMSLKMGLTP